MSPANPEAFVRGAEPAPDRGEDALALAEPAVRVVNGELHLGVGERGHRLLVEVREEVALLQPADQHLDLGEGCDRCHLPVASPSPTRSTSSRTRSSATIRSWGHVAVGVLRDRGLRDAERVGDLVLGEAALAEVLRQHRAHRREELVDDDLLDEPHDSCSAAWFSSL